LVFEESRIVVQKRQSLLAGTDYKRCYLRDLTTLMNGESDIAGHKCLFLLSYAYKRTRELLTLNNNSSRKQAFRQGESVASGVI
jgi:hypothetical protein